MTRESEFYNILEPYDAVMADRGFTIVEDLLVHRADQGNVDKNSSRKLMYRISAFL